MESLNIKYRPHTLEDVTEQLGIIKVLKRTVETRAFKHAYLFAGPSGCGKTTLARIFANLINQGAGEPIELNATTMGIEEVRNLGEDANRRAIVGEYKIYIIDECHKLGGNQKDAWNGLLKILEECPEYTIFMFCTTEPDKIIPTILNRVQRYNLGRISKAGIKNRLDYICQKEGFTNYADTCELISRIADGGMRNAITYLDQCVDYSTDLCLENTKDIIGDVTNERMLKITSFLLSGDEAHVLYAISKLYNEGIDLRAFIGSYQEFILDLDRYVLLGNIELTNIPQYLETEIKPLVNFNGSNIWLMNVATTLLDLRKAIKNDNSYKSTIETYLLKMCRWVQK